MANIKITDLNAIADPISTDVLPIVDVSADTTNKISIEDLLKNAAAGTAAAPAFAFDADPNTGMYRSGADALAFSTGGTGRLFIDSSGNIGVGTSSADLPLVVKKTSAGGTGGAIRLLNNSTTTGSKASLIFTTTTNETFNSARIDGERDATGTNIVFSSSDVERLRIDSSGNLGIGSSSVPRGPVSIYNSSAPLIHFWNDTTTSNANNGTSVYGFQDDFVIQNRETNGVIQFQTANTERLRIDSSGRVGIGTSSPSTNLEVSSTSYPQFRVTDSVASVSTKVMSTPTTGNIGTHTNHDLQVVTNNTERMRIDSSGRLGLGTSSPAQLLHLNASSANATQWIAAGTGYTSNLSLLANGSGGGLLLSSATDSSASITNSLNAALTFGTNNTERLRIDSSGNVGIGTTTVAARLHVVGANAANCLIDNDGSQYTQLLLQRNGTINTGGDILIDGTSGEMQLRSLVGPLVFKTSPTAGAHAERARLDSSGRLLVGTTTARSNFFNSTFSPRFQLEGPTDTARIASIVSNNVSGAGGVLVLASEKSGAAGGNTAVSDNGQLGLVSFQGNDGSDFVEAVRIEAQVDGTPGANDMPGRLVFSTTADGASSPTERLRIASSGNVGIGISAPTSGSKLHVQNASSGATANSQYADLTVENSAAAGVTVLSGASSFGGFVFGDSGSGDVGGFFYDHSNDAMIHKVNGAERLRVDSSGRVGIGNSSPTQELCVRSSSGTEADILIEGNNGASGGLTIFHNAADCGIWNSANTNLKFATNGTERVRIDGSGRVGIGGTSSTSAALMLTNSSYPSLQMTYGGSNALHRIDWDSAGLAIRADSGNAVANSKITFDVDGSERMRIDSSGRLGIGTSAPGSYSSVANNLVVQDTAGEGGITIVSTTTGGSNIFFADTDSASQGQIKYQHSGDYMRFYTANSERLRIDSSGRVGIGTTSATNNLHVYGSDSAIRIQDSDGGNLQLGGWDGVSNLIQSTGKEFRLITSDSQAIVLGTNYFTNGEALRIDTSGRLLVGTSASLGNGATLQTSGQQVNYQAFHHQTAQAGPFVILSKSNGTQASPTVVTHNDYLGIIGFSGYDGTDYLTRGAEIACQVDGTPGANDMPGRLVFSTTADGASSPTERMRISHTGEFNFYSSATSGGGFRSSYTAGTSQNLITGLYSATSTTTGTLSFLVRTNGNVLNTNNSYGAISDAKLKENIVDASSQWDDIKDLRVRKYNFIQGQTHTQLGVVAQEVETVSPGLVTESPDFDEEGNDLGTTTKSVNYSVLYMKAVKALQEAMERIETLEQRLTDAGL